MIPVNLEDETLAQEDNGQSWPKKIRSTPMTNDPAGSTWKKWDLHVHTPSSIIHNYQGTNEEAWEAFLLDLEALPPEFKVIGINDYIFIDGYERVRKAKLEQNRLKNIDLVLPVIELRLDKFAGVVKKETNGSYSQSSGTASTCTSSSTRWTPRSFVNSSWAHWHPATT